MKSLAWQRLAARAGVAAIAAVVALPGLEAGAPVTSAAIPAAQARLPGINAQFLPPPSARTARDQAFAAIQGLGVRIARIDTNWADIERTPGTYDWSRLDPQVDELVRHGLAPRLILDYSNPLYSTAGAAKQASGIPPLPPFGIGEPIYYPPDSPAPFAAWAGRLAARYRGRARFMEVWNEENSGYRFWEPHEDPAAYAALLKATYVAVKAVAPEDQVAFGGTFYPAVDVASAAADGIPIPNSAAAQQLGAPHQGTLTFVENALQADPTLGNYFDAMAYHPYHFPYMAPEVDIPIEGTIEGSMIAVRALLDRHHLASTPIWITEVGWPNNTAAYGATVDKSASYLVRTFATAWSHGIEQVDWYCYGDGGSDSTYNQESAFGIVDGGGVPKPAFHAWNTLNALVGNLPYLDSQAAALGLPGDGHALRFGAGATTVTVAWLAPETMYSDQGPEPVAAQAASVATPPGTIAIYDMRGVRQPLQPTFNASAYPLYLVQDVSAATTSPAVNGGLHAQLPNTAR